MIEENITNEISQTYAAYNGLTTVYDDIHELHGSCYGMSVNYNWKADEYQGIIDAKYFSRIYEKVCTKPNQPFPDLNQSQEVAFAWSKPEDRTTECTVDLNGIVQEEVMNCNSTYRCVVEKGCNEEDEKLPKLATNQQLLLTWKRG